MWRVVSTPRPTSVTPVGLSQLATLAAAAPDAAAGDVEVTGVTLDSRQVMPGDLYAALPGARFHGASFAAQAREAGAVAVLTDGQGAALVRAAGVDLPTITVADPRAVLGDLSARVYGTDRRRPVLVGVTGTNGKTTTAYLITAALDALGRTTGLVGTVETRIAGERLASTRTTPESPDLHALIARMVEVGVDTCVMEVSSHALALHRVDGLVFDIALFTNLTQDHLDFHSSMEDYFTAKSELFTRRRSRRGIVCIDDAYGRRLSQTSEVPVETLGQDAAADWQVRPSCEDPGALTLTHQGRVEHLRSALPGDFNLTNTALAAATLVTAGVDPADASRALSIDPHVPGRMEVVSVGDGPQIPRVVVDYAHTPEAIRAALSALRPSTEGLLVCVTGAGGDRDRDKRAAMGAAAAAADIVVVTDDNPRSEDPAVIRRAVLEGAQSAAAHSGRMVRVIEVGDRRAAIEDAIRRVVGDPRRATVAVVGKGHESGQEVAGVTHPFDDRAEVRAAMLRVLEEPS